MKKCSNCGRENTGEAAACAGCGTSLSRTEEATPNGGRGGGTPTWVVVGGIVAVIAVIVGGVVWSNLRGRLVAGRERSEAVSCGLRLQQLASAAMVWSLAHGPGRSSYPTSFAAMQSELPSPILLICLNDSGNPMRGVTNWSQFDFKFSSYELLAAGMPVGDGSKAFARCKIHGLVCDGEGALMDGDRER